MTSVFVRKLIVYKVKELRINKDECECIMRVEDKIKELDDLYYNELLVSIATNKKP